jgi:hypothetical protein
MSNTINSSSADYDYGRNYTPGDGDDAICENPEILASSSESLAYDEEVDTDEGASESGVHALTRRGSKNDAQYGEVYERAQAEGGSEGASSVSLDDAPAPLNKPGGNVYSLDGNVGAGVGTLGLSGALVRDDECGWGYMSSASGGAQTPGAGANLTLGVTEYQGSFQRFNDAYQVTAGAGAGLYGEGRVLLDSQTGEPIGAGVAAGIGAGVGVSGTTSESAVYFPLCPQY